MSTFRTRTLEATERGGAALTADIESVEVHTATPSGLRVSYVADEDSPTYHVESVPVVDGDEVDTEDADRVEVGEQFLITFTERDQ